MVFVAAGIILAVLYFFLQVYYLLHWRRLETFQSPNDFEPSFRLSVIVVAHNEEAYIRETIKSILQQSMPQSLWELIIVDDRSVDRTAEIANQFQNERVRIVRLADFPAFIHPPAFKKSGIEAGVHLSRFDYIVVTDADCVHHKEWLKTIASAIKQSGAIFMTGPLLIKDAIRPVEKMQQMECMGLLLATAGGIHSGLHVIANGANMAFSKKAFQDINGYEGNYHYASGDDMFLAEKMKQHYPEKINFVKSPDAAVYTNARHSWDTLIRQRIRWAGKNKGLKNSAVSTIWLFIGAYHLTLFLFLWLSILSIYAFIGFCILLLTKLIVDFFSLDITSRFFGKKINLIDYFTIQVVYTWYIITLGFHLLTGKKGDWR